MSVNFNTFMCTRVHGSLCMCMYMCNIILLHLHYRVKVKHLQEPPNNFFFLENALKKATEYYEKNIEHERTLKLIG